MFTYSADRWELYTVNMDCSAAARALNEALERAFKELPALIEPKDPLGLELRMRPESAADVVFEKHLSPVMRKFSSCGADDSEPRYFAREKLRAFAKALA